MKVRSHRGGFSLIELLTVIAIIAILAAIIFPVMGTVKERARQNQCMTQLQQIGMAIDMYKKDNRKYPTTLGPQAVAGQTMEQVTNSTTCLFPEYVKSFKMFHCPDSNVTNTTDTVTYQNSQGQDITVYAYDTYDAFVQGAAMPYTADIHYQTQWTTDSTNPNFSRQMRFRTPPSDTVVTWCSYHQTYKKAPVLFLDGHTELMSADTVASSTWQTKPTP